MIDRLDTRRLRHVLTVVLLFLSQLAAIAAAAQPSCPCSDCGDEAAVEHVVRVLADTPADGEDHTPACQIVASTCSLGSPCVPGVAHVGMPAEHVAGTLLCDDLAPHGLTAPPPYGPPRT
jgi:hypothetical protein